MSEFTFAPAVRENTPMIMALAGASGTGKTFTALELVMGLIERPMTADSNGKALLVDTEGRRGLHYADLMLPKSERRFLFDHCDFRAPYSPGRFLEVLRQAEAAHYAAIIVDSASDEYIGEGGLVDMANEIGEQYKASHRGREMNSAATWAKPKAQHKTVVRWLRQSRCHLIFCIRAEEKVKLEAVQEAGAGGLERSKKVIKVIPIGWQPICEKNFMYDMTASFMFHPDAPGVPHPIKLQEQHRPFFPAGEKITRDAGRALAAWCAGGLAGRQPAPPLDEELAELVAQAWDAARRGMRELEQFCKALSRAQRASIKALVINELQPIAQRVDDDVADDMQRSDNYEYDRQRQEAADIGGEP